MTAPDPLREDEVEAVARAMAIALDGYPYADDEPVIPDHLEAARAAILRLDQVREGRGK